MLLSSFSCLSIYIKCFLPPSLYISVRTERVNNRKFLLWNLAHIPFISSLNPTYTHEYIYELYKSINIKKTIDIICPSYTLLYLCNTLIFTIKLRDEHSYKYNIFWLLLTHRAMLWSGFSPVLSSMVSFFIIHFLSKGQALIVIIIEIYRPLTLFILYDINSSFCCTLYYTYKYDLMHIMHAFVNICILPYVQSNSIVIVMSISSHSSHHFHFLCFPFYPLYMLCNEFVW